MDKEEIAQGVWETTDTMYRVAKSILRRDVDCEDAVSQAIVNAFEHLDSLKKPQYARTWLIRIVMNECFRLAKEKKQEQCREEKGISIDVWKESGREQPIRDYSELYGAMRSLPSTYHTALMLYYIEGYSIKEIADIQDTSVAGVKMRLSRGRKMLKRLMEIGEEEDGYDEGKRTGRTNEPGISKANG